MSDKVGVECVCYNPCQARRMDGSIRTYAIGEKDFFPDVPKWFVEVKSVSVDKTDIGLVNERILRDETIVPTADLIAYVKETYGEDLTGVARDSVVEKIMYYRHSPVELTHGGSKPVLAHEYKKTKKELKNAGLTVVMSDEEVPIETPKENADDPVADSDIDDLLKM